MHTGTSTAHHNESDESFAVALDALGKSVLLGKPGASFTLQSLLTEAGITWEQHAMTLLSLILRPATTMEGLREFTDTVFLQPLTAYYQPPESATISLLEQYSTAFAQVATVTFGGPMPPTELATGLD